MTKRKNRMPKDEPRAHGGKRPGAGRPKLFEDLISRHVYLDPKSDKIISERASATGQNYSNVLREIVAYYAKNMARRSTSRSEALDSVQQKTSVLSDS